MQLHWSIGRRIVQTFAEPLALPTVPSYDLQSCRLADLPSPSASPEADLDLETRSLAPLRAAFDRLQQQGGVDLTLTFSSLLSDSPRSQHDLSEGVHEKQRAALLSRCSTDAKA